MAEKFYEVIIGNSSSKYYKIEGIIDGLKRIDTCSLENLFYWKPVKPLTAVLYTNKKLIWPDFIHDYHWKKYYIFSEKVFDLFDQLGFPNTRSYKVNIKYTDESDIIKDCPSYFLLNIDSLQGAKLVDDGSWDKNSTVCPECKRVIMDFDVMCEIMDNEEELKSIIDKSTWNGKMLFKMGGIYLHCTFEFIEKIREAKITNFVFEDIETEKKILKYR